MKQRTIVIRLQLICRNRVDRQCPTAVRSLSAAGSGQTGPPKRCCRCFLEVGLKSPIVDVGAGRGMSRANCQKTASTASCVSHDETVTAVKFSRRQRLDAQVTVPLQLLDSLAHFHVPMQTFE